MILSYLLLISGLSISAIAEYYSIMGLMAIFSASPIPIAVMGISLGVAKLVMASWVKQYWARIPSGMKAYGVTAVVILMLITTIGCFGFLSKAHNDQNLVSGDVGAKLAIYDEKIATARSNIEADRKAIKQMDEAVDQVMARSTSEGGADKANAIRKSQQRDRSSLAKDIETQQKIVAQLNDEASPIRAEVRKVEAEVGPIKYIAAFIYGVAPDASMLEKAVTWIIILIVIVFDPLAVIMLLASQMTFAWLQKKEEPQPAKIVVDLNRDHNDADYDIPLFDEREPIPDYTDYSEGTETSTADPEPEEELPVKPRWAGFSFPMFNHISQPKIVEPEQQTVAEPVLITHIAYPESNAPGLDASNERPGDYVKPIEAAPGPNRGVMTSRPIQADTDLNLGKASNSSFGNEYPKNPEKGDVYLRTDYLPNRLFKFNGDRWIEVDKAQTDVYAYDELYIKHLVEEIDAGHYDTESLTDLERSQIEEFLNKK